MKISFLPQSVNAKSVLVVGILEGKKLTPQAEAVNKATKGYVEKVLKASGTFTGKFKNLMTLPAPQGLSADLLILVGMGDPKKIKAACINKLGGFIVGQLQTAQKADVDVSIDAVGSFKEADFAALLAEGAVLRSYRFDKYRTKMKAEDKPTLKNLNILVKDVAGAKKAFAQVEPITDAIFKVRDLVNEPANVLYPATFAAEAKKLEKLGVKVEVLGEKEMTKLGMNALLGVGVGSAKESKMIIMHYNNNKAQKKPLAFIGKGVTFDTGGISIKPAGGMEEMKGDMAGAAAVFGTIMALAGRKAKVNVVGLIGAVENMPDGAAQRPGDIVTSMSGQTIEILNTDAEGRLVLADVLWYCQKRFNPEFMVDLATLTGAIRMALGDVYAGLMSNDDKVADRLFKAGQDTQEMLWRMPLHDEYDACINTPIADVKNTGERGAGSITAAHFLKRFVNDKPWAHLDIAAVEWVKKANDLMPEGATGFGVRLLNNFVKQNYEK